MAEMIDRMELSNDQRVELDEDGITWFCAVTCVPAALVGATKRPAIAL